MGRLPSWTTRTQGCSMSTIDEILASGRYTDRPGREWAELGRAWVLVDPGYWAGWAMSESLGVQEMRLLIERDQHRVECLGLWECANNPVPVVHFENGAYWGRTCTLNARAWSLVLQLRRGHGRCACTGGEVMIVLIIAAALIPAAVWAAIVLEPHGGVMGDEKTAQRGTQGLRRNLKHRQFRDRTSDNLTKR